MTEILVIRHTQAEGNLYRVFQGWWNGRVTKEGRKQIDALAERMREEKLDAVYASDLDRAYETALGAARFHPEITVQKVPGLREINPGIWEAMPMGELIKKYPLEFQEFITYKEDWHVEGAETFAELKERVVSAVTELAKKHDGQRIAIVSHGVTIRCLIAACQKKSMSEALGLFVPHNTSINTIRYDNGDFEIVSLDDCDHLKTIQADRQPRLREPQTAFYYENADPRVIKDLFLKWVKDAWELSYAPLGGTFDKNRYYKSALDNYKNYPGALKMAYFNNQPVGLLQLDTERGKEKGIGWVSLIYLIPEYRHRGLAAQLIGMAVLYYREIGRKSVQLEVSRANKYAMQLYEDHDFYVVSENERTVIMEKGGVSEIPDF